MDVLHFECGYLGATVEEERLAMSAVLIGLHQYEVLHMDRNGNRHRDINGYWDSMSRGRCPDSPYL